MRLIHKRWKKQLQNFRILAQRYGQFRSMGPDGTVDQEGEPIAWLTYPALEYLDSFDFQAKTVFEFGAGNSSLYWARRAKHVTSVEAQAPWFEVTRARKGPNQVVLHAGTEDEYVSTIDRQRQRFDVVVVDGHWRLRTAEAAIRNLADDGMIIVDNSDWSPASNRVLRDAGFFQIDFNGFGPSTRHTWTTSIFVKLRSGLQANFADPHPVGGRAAPEDFEACEPAPTAHPRASTPDSTT